MPVNCKKNILIQQIIAESTEKKGKIAGTDSSQR